MADPMTVLVCGDRDWTDFEFVRQTLQTLPKGSTIIEGCARGADRCGEDAAKFWGFTVRHFPANWRGLGRGAGPIRNRMMADQEPDLVWAFHDRITESKGTLDMLRVARERGLSTMLFTHYGAFSRYEDALPAPVSSPANDQDQHVSVSPEHRTAEDK